MKKFLLVVFAFLAYNVVWAGENEEGINFFQGSFEEAIAKAKQEKKILFVDIYTEWCAPCKIMAKEVFPNPDVAAYYNANFINYSLDAEDEDQNGPDIAEVYEVSAYPTFLFLNGEGELVDTAKGGLDVDVFLDVGKRANGEGETWQELEAKYKANDRNDQFLFNYFVKAKLHSMKLLRGEELDNFFSKISGQAEEYLTGLNHDQLINASVFQIIQDYTVGPNRGQPLTEFVIDNYASYIEIVTPIEINQYIGLVNYKSIKKLSEAGDESYKPYLEDIRGKLAPAYDGLGSRYNGDDPYLSMKEFADSTHALAVKDWALYLDVCQSHVDRMGDKVQLNTLVSISKDMLEAGCEDKEYLQRAVEYNRMAYEKKNSLFTAVNYARLLARLNDPRAKPVLEDAVAQCEKMGSRADKVREEFEAMLVTMNK